MLHADCGYLQLLEFHALNQGFVIRHAAWQHNSGYDGPRPGSNSPGKPPRGCLTPLELGKGLPGRPRQLQACLVLCTCLPGQALSNGAGGFGAPRRILEPCHNLAKAEMHQSCPAQEPDWQLGRRARPNTAKLSLLAFTGPLC